jgi:uncharacterized protein
MLIEFSVANFRSVKQKQTFSFVSAKGNELAETNTFHSPIGKLSPLLRSAVMYGANASGKSNFLRALGFMHFLILNSFGALQEGQLIPVTPFLFDSDSTRTPSEFEIMFVHDGVRYQYGFAATQQRILEEWLIAYPEGKPQRWFERIYDEKASLYEWQFSRSFIGQKEIIKTATRANALFLSTAIQLNNDQLKPIFNWFLGKLDVILPGVKINLQFTIDQCSSEQGKQRILSFMNAADISIANIQFEKKAFDPVMVPPILIPELRDKVIADLYGKELTSVRFLHDSKTGGGILDLNDESQGTQKLFAFAGPWLDVLSKGKVLVVDELDTSLHPLLVRHLVSLFHNPKTNPLNAQLLISTHDTTLLDPDNYRRDQVWFTEKDDHGTTRLYSLAEFKPRKNEAFERGYLKGRYGALPFIGDFYF